ncbi:phage terminase small subunit [Nitrosospira multiformis]|uniref:Phage terminase small subunit n=1 Tax=Nitrosospira multiformis TaxID=1231 RepID=A0A1H8IZ73_9PROT|nr:terminase small subunit [Nitrosospira multiformis]SEN73782.1 phage terminase small subunit [Nitrosospira multiformis]
MKKLQTLALTPKQQRFVVEYCVDFNATAAYIRAGYDARGNSAEAAASRLLSNVKVQEAIEQKQREVAKRCELTTENIVREAAAVAFSDIRKLFNRDGSPKAIHEMDDATAAAISTIEVGQTITDGKVTGRTCRIRLWDKNSAQERLFRHMGLFRKESALKQPLRKMKVVFVSSDGEVVPFSGHRNARET